VSQQDSSLMDLRRSLVKIQGRGTWRAGVVSLALGIVLLAAGFLTKYLFFEIDALIALLLGLILVFRNTQTDTWRDLGIDGLVSAYASIGDLLPRNGEPITTTYLPAQSSGEHLAVVSFSVVQGAEDGSATTGVSVSVNFPGAAIYAALERRLPDMSRIGVEAVIGLLPGLLVDDLDLVHSVDFKPAGNSIRMRIEGSAYAQVFESSPRVASALGCPITSAVAALLADAASGPIRVETRFDSKLGVATASFEVLPQPKKAS
jgi:hypothetical protein